VVVGAGQTPGETIGNGRAMALLVRARRRQGALRRSHRGTRRGDRPTDHRRGGEALAMAADVTKAADCARIIDEAKARFGRIDVLINNVGIGGGDGPAHRLEEAPSTRILAVNLKGMWLVTKAALAVMREQAGGSIVNISSLAAVGGGIQLAYEVSKAGVNRLTTSVAQSNARYGIRANAIMMGYMDTPMAVSGIAAASGRSTAEVRAERDARVPLAARWAPAGTPPMRRSFLASDEAQFITGEVLRVDGGMGTRIG
jgi:NAD(P)-dependent dehydrogenase (short-subunit alcohol dehydrogenase family)